MRFVRALTLGFVMLAASPAALSIAQDDPDTETIAESRATSFEADRGAQTEELPGGALLIAAYGVIWLLVLGYVISLAMRQASTARDLERLRQDMKAAGPAKEQ